MTTIAWRAGVMAADSLATDDTAIQVRKLIRLPAGQVAGGAGDLGEVASGLVWLQNGCAGDAPAIPNAIFLYTMEGVCYVASAAWPGLEVKGPAAIGSGAQGAMVAMCRAAMDAEAAVRAVAGIDPATGGEIDVLAVEPVSAKPRRKRPR